MSNFGNEYGWASSDTLEYECVLADGTVATVTKDNEHAELFWAPRGGGNSSPASRWFITIKADREAIRLFHDTSILCRRRHLDHGPGHEHDQPRVRRGRHPQRRRPRTPWASTPRTPPYIMFEVSMTWYSADDDDTIQAFYTAFNANISAQLTEMGVLSPYFYLNDANGDQDVFAGYPLENVNKLKTIREKYDPDRVYTDRPDARRLEGRRLGGILLNKGNSMDRWMDG